MVDKDIKLKTEENYPKESIFERHKRMETLINKLYQLLMSEDFTVMERIGMLESLKELTFILPSIKKEVENEKQ